MKIKILFIVILFFVLGNFSLATISEHFDEFYENYLCIRKVDKENRENLDLMNKIANGKFSAIEKFINSTDNICEKAYGISLIDEEYRDFIENINFELNYVPNCPISKRCTRKLKRAHKKYMRLLEKCYLEN